MLRSFDALALRQMRTRRLRVLLTGFGIVLGVGMVFGVLLVTGTIRHTFDELINSAWGKVDLVAQSKSYGQLPNRTLTAVRGTQGVSDASPMIGQGLQRLHADGRAIEGQAGRMMVAGLDPANFGYSFSFPRGRMVRSGNEIVVDESWAARRGLKVGELIHAGTPAGRATLRLVGIFRFGGGVSFGEQGFAAIPLSTARRLFDQPTGYMQLLIRATDRSNVKPLQRRLQRALGPGVTVKTPQGYSDEIAKQLQSFNVVLYFFSGIALFVGCFLILNSFNMTVLQRMRELGMLRTLGASRAMVTRSVLVEAMSIGAIGSVLGLALGLALGVGLLSLISSLGVPAGSVHVSAGAAVIALGVGLIATAVGALYPARRAGRIAPIRAVLGTAQLRRRPSVMRALIGFAIFAPAVWLSGRFWFGSGGAGSGLAAAAGVALTMAMFVGMVLAAPYLILPVVRALAVPLRRLLPSGGRLAANAALSNPSRTAATAVALTVGLSVIVVNSAVSASVLSSIDDQISAAYARDFTVQPEGGSLQSGQTFGPGVARRLAALAGIAVATPVRTLLIKLPGSTSGQPGVVMGVDPARWGAVDRTPVRDLSRAQALAGLARGGILVTPGYAKSAHLRVGDTLALQGPAGTRRAPVVGVLGASVSGLADAMQLSLATMRGVYGVTGDSQVAVKVAPGADRARVGNQIDGLLTRDYPQLESLSTGAVKDQINTQVDTQFTLFNAIVAIAVIVSLLGVINTLAMSVLERTREIGVLRALGSSRWLVRRTMLDESLLITIAGAVAGIVLGLVVAFVWVQGLDTLLPGVGFSFPVTTIAAIAVAAVVLGAVAAILPARRAARLNPIEAINYE
jgi:putative ABC transport system permease protein